MKKPLVKALFSLTIAGSLVVPGTAVLPPSAAVVSAAEQSAQPSIYIAPIDRAKFLAGSRFDFRVELNDLREKPASVSITINGQAADAYFGKTLVRTETDTSVEYTVRDVTFNEAGVYEVAVAAGGMSKSVRYEVVQADQSGAKAKNVILFVGDGMALPAVTIARIMSKGMTEGKYNGLLEMDTMEQRAIVTTSGMDSVVTDSANSASAYSTGHKSAVNALGIYPDNTEDTLDDPKVETLAEMLKRTRGASIGVVSTSEIQDATPASVVSHTRRRDDKQEITEMLHKLQPEVILGGGAAYFLPQSTPGSKRKDDKDLFGMFEQSGYTVVENAEQMKAAGTPNKLLGMFHPGNMSVYYDRSTSNTPALDGFADQPNLWDMTQKAIDVLSQNENGFLLVIEGASIDKQLHTLDWERAAYDTIEMDKALGVAKRFAEQNGETLVVVTADHAHSLSIAGTYWEGDGKSGREALRTYQNSLFPTYTDSNGDGFPDTPDADRKLAVVFGAYPDYYEDYRFDEVPTVPAIRDSEGSYVANPAKLADPQDPNRDRFYRTGTMNPTGDSQGVHSADDVPLMAYGPGATYFKGTMDNTDVFFGMVDALGLNLTGEPGDGKQWTALADFTRAVGGTVHYDGAASKVTAVIQRDTFVFDLNGARAMKNGQPAAVDFKFENGKTYVSFESLLQALTK